jgi:ribulose-phosphate 3-epimerase
VAAVRPHAKKLFFDVHLMCGKPEILLEPFVHAGADEIIVHVELHQQVTPLIWKIKSLGCKVGLAINPLTSIAEVQPFLDKIDLLLVMTVNPGFGGQSFIHECLSKIQQADAWRRERKLNCRLEVDGGINNQTVAECARAGADTFVAGTALFHKRNMGAAIRKMRKIAHDNDPTLADLKV